MNKFSRLFPLFILLFLTVKGQAQNQVDSIYFNLYTDSLKKGGVHNYINIDGKLKNGQWRPLTAKEITFSCSAGKFQGNDLVIDSGFSGEKVQVKAILKENPAVWKEVTIYIKKVETVERLKTVDEILNRPEQPSRRNRRRG